MSLDLQDIIALLVVVVAILALAIRSGIFGRVRKRPREMGCRACMKCNRRAVDAAVEEIREK